MSMNLLSAAHRKGKWRFLEVLDRSMDLLLVLIRKCSFPDSRYQQSAIRNNHEETGH